MDGSELRKFTGRCLLNKKPVAFHVQAERLGENFRLNGFSLQNRYGPGTPMREWYSGVYPIALVHPKFLHIFLENPLTGEVVHYKFREGDVVSYDRFCRILLILQECSGRIEKFFLEDPETPISSSFIA